MASSPEVVNIFANTLPNTMYVSNIAIFMMTVGKLGLMDTGHITLGYAALQGCVVYRALESMLGVTVPALASIGIKVIG